MARSKEDTASRIASCTDYDSSNEEELTATRKQANVAAKRTSHSSGLGIEFAASMTQPPLPDISSDSGYSSRTQATVASADSEESIKVKSNAANPNAATSETNTALSSNSGKRDGKRPKRVIHCDDPNCTHRRKPKTSSTASPVKPDARSPSRPSASSRPSRQAQPAEREAPQVHQQQLRPRAASTTGTRPRSYYGGMPTAAPPMAYYGRHGYPYAPQTHMIVNRAMTPGPRPEMTHRATDISARSVRPGASYGAPVILQQQDKPRNELSARRPPKTHTRFEEPATESEEEEDSGEEEETSEDDDDEEASLEILKKLAAEQDRRKKQAQIAAARAKLEADRIAMPPPSSQPAATQNSGAQFSMRRPTQNPKITYGAPAVSAPNNEADFVAALRQMGIGTQRPPLVPGAVKATSYAHPALGLGTGLSADVAARQQPRRNSFYGGEGVEEMEANHLLHAAGLYGREKEQRRKILHQQQLLLQQQKRASADVDGLLGARFQNLAIDQSSSPPTIDPKLRDAQSYIDRDREGAPPREQAQLTEGVVRRLDRDAASTRSKRSSREGSSTAGRSRRRLSAAGQVEADAEGIKMRIDTKQDYEIEIGNQRVEIRPSGEGSLDLYIGGKRETPYHSTRGSISTKGSKLGRRPSSRAARDRDRGYHDDESDIPEERDEPEAHEEPEERHSVRPGGPRRRAETYGTYETERARYETERARRAPPPSRRTSSRDARGEEVSRERDRSREQRYRGPPRYGVAPDEYSRSPPTPSSYQRYGVPRYDAPSPRPPQGYGYGGTANQNYEGFGA